ncbi:MAG: hypothetical protein SCJ93_04645 [Bacillota bacterium]|nr:hypothetical protein [Bacillota bacterium]
MKTKTLSLLNLFTFALVLTVNALANILPINGMTTGDVSDNYINLFTPAGFTFSIWGLIYTLLGIFVVYQVVLNFKNYNSKFVEKIGYWFIISNLLNSLWIYTWHNLMISINLVIMLMLLISLIRVYLRLDIGNSRDDKNIKMLVHIPFSIYLGWISVATIANFSAFFVSFNWNGFGLSETFWTVLVLAVAILLGIIFTIRNKDIFYTLVVVWAFIGILSKRLSVEVSYPIIIGVVSAGIGLLGLLVLYSVFKKRVYIK